MNSTCIRYFSLIVSTLFLSLAHAEDDQQWHSIPVENQVYMQTSEGLIIIELAPFMAPKHVERFTSLVNSGFYDGLDFYRVIDGFVAQGGDMNESRDSDYRSPLPAEFSRKIPAQNTFFSVQQPAFLAPQTGYLDGFPAGQDISAQQQWLLHCPGTVAMARGNEANSATTDFYIVLGQAPRHLDRNMSSFGRVVFGMENVQRLARAPHNAPGGVIEKPQLRSRIEWAKMASAIPAQQRIALSIQRPQSDAVEERLSGAQSLQGPFFHHPGSGNLDVCYYQLRIKASAP
ncbi:peptidylprolyl isomerase [Aestuariibacter halophilus]|uniref:peptidylprolyl isomerase n=1 Tax=Fluctibacter halophilus TaxID=226011 RepID=A0ABS8G5G2_9ALTE|nr:peptidylprolyl isomerase [Aestuariibacter halophilus]MCC2615822.1 peptidylprolyl isomerase [Aestuariibacter halophilus]